MDEEIKYICDGCGGSMREVKVRTVHGQIFCKACFMNENPRLMAALKKHSVDSKNKTKGLETYN